MTNGFSNWAIYLVFIFCDFVYDMFLMIGQISDLDSHGEKLSHSLPELQTDSDRFVETSTLLVSCH